MADDPLTLTLPHMQKKAKSARFAWLCVACVLVATGLAGAGFWWWQSQIFDKAARVASSTLPLVAETDGRVTHVATLNDTVTAGQVVVQLDNGPFAARLEEARARLAAVTPGQESSASVRKAEEQLQAGVEAARQLEQQARRDVEHYASAHAQALLAMRRPDVQRAGGSRLNTAQLAEMEARTNLENAKRVFATHSRTRALAEGDLARFRKDLLAVAQMAQNPEVLARVQEVLAQRVREAEMALAATVITASQEGRLSRLGVSPGSFVQTGQTVGEVTPSRVRLLAHVRPADAVKIASGQAVRIRYIGLAEQPFAEGTVRAVLPQDSDGRVPVQVEGAIPGGVLPAQDSLAEVKFLNFLF